MLHVGNDGRLGHWGMWERAREGRRLGRRVWRGSRGMLGKVGGQLWQVRRRGRWQRRWRWAGQVRRWGRGGVMWGCRKALVITHVVGTFSKDP